MSWHKYNLIPVVSSPNLTQPPSPLYNSTSNISGDSGIMASIQDGLAADKILLGFPYYGFAWSLVDPDDHGIFAPANGTPIAITGGALVIRSERLSKRVEQKLFSIAP